MPIRRYNQLGGEVIVGVGSLNQLPDKVIELSPYKTGLITDRRVGRIHKDTINALKKSLNINLYMELNEGEGEKNINTIIKIWNILYKEGFTRKSLLIGLGGGVIGDITGFAAATYMRGIHYINIPTTLLAQADSSIGGKNAVDMGVKNLIGTFYTPNITIIDPSFLTTLSQRQIANGMAEIIKHGIIASEKLISIIEEKLDDILSKDLSTLEDIIRLSVEIKIDIVSRDYREKGLRKVLNLGHTIGHALETILDYRISHGEAVSIGIASISEISEKILGFKERDRIVSLLEQYNLPTKLRVDPNTLMDAIMRDKKNLRDKITLILIQRIGGVIIRDFDRNEVRGLLGDIYE